MVGRRIKIGLVIALTWGFSAAVVSVCAPQETAPPPVGAVGGARSLRVASVSMDDATPPSRFGILTSRRWAYGVPYVRENLEPVPNPHPAPEPQPVRGHPFEVEVSADGTKVYIAFQGTELLPGSQVAVFDVAQGRVVKRIDLKPPDEPGAPGSSPFRMILHPAGRYLFVTNRYSNFISVIDTRSDSVISEIPIDFYCQGLTFNPSGDVAYITNRYLDQVLVIDVSSADDRFEASVRVLGGVDDQAYFGDGPNSGIHAILARRCGMTGCHAGDAAPLDRNAIMRRLETPVGFPSGNFLLATGGFIAGGDRVQSFITALEHVQPGDSGNSRLLAATVGVLDGGYGDMTPKFQSHPGGVIFRKPATDPDYQAIAKWIDSTREGPGIHVGNPRSKPKTCVLSSDGRHLFVGNTGTQDISIVDTTLLVEVGAIYTQNVVNDVNLYHSPANGHDYLLVTTEGIGFGVVKERDPYGGESWDTANPLAQYSVWRNTQTGKPLPRGEQRTLGPYDAVDGTSEIKFRDIQNDLVIIDVSALKIPGRPAAEGLPYVLKVNRYEAHRNWVRYTSDTAESTYGDIKGDIPPDLMRVVGAFPEKMAVIGDRLFVTMQGSNQVQELKIDTAAIEPSDFLTPVRTYDAGLQPIGIAAGPAGTPAEGLVFACNFLGGSLTIIDTAAGRSREVIVDPLVERIPVPATNAERGEVMAHTALFSSDGDTSCFHCHYLDMGEGRPWGVSQVLGQEFLSKDDQQGHLAIAGTMSVPQMRGLFEIQPFFFEGVISGYEPRSMIMEHCPSDDFNLPTPHGDFTGIEAHYPMSGYSDIQSKMTTSTNYEPSLEERRDEMFRRQSMKVFGKAFTLRDFQRFVGEWQMHEPRLLPNPFDPANRSILRGKQLFEDPQVGCVSCHPAPGFAKKDFADNPNQAIAPVVTFTVRDGSFTLLGKNREDVINGHVRDLEPWDAGRAETKQGHFTSFPLRGIWDRPPVFLHNGMARTLHEVVASPAHPALRKLKYEPLFGGYPERPGRKEVGFNMTHVYATAEPRVKMHLVSEARLGFDTHGGTSQLTRRQVDDLVNFLNSIE